MLKVGVRNKMKLPNKHLVRPYTLSIRSIVLFLHLIWEGGKAFYSTSQSSQIFFWHNVHFYTRVGTPTGVLVIHLKSLHNLSLSLSHQFLLSTQALPTQMAYRVFLFLFYPKVICSFWQSVGGRQASTHTSPSSKIIWVWF